MAKKKTIKTAPKATELTQKERKQMREKLSSIAKITPEDLITAISEEPDGQLAVNVVMDALWPKFKEVFKVGMPAKGRFTSDVVYQKQLENYRKWTAGIRSIAKYWYLAGMNHEQNHKDILSVLNPSKDADAPVDVPEEAAHADVPEEKK